MSVPEEEDKYHFHTNIICEAYYCPVFFLTYYYIFTCNYLSVHFLYEPIDATSGNRKQREMRNRGQYKKNWKYTTIITTLAVRCFALL